MSRPADAESHLVRVAGALTGSRAANAMAEITASVTGEQLVIDCAQLTDIDAYGSAILRTGLDRHLCADLRNKATIVEPDASDIWPYLSDALGRLPAGSTWAGTRSTAARGTDVMVPAMPIRLPLDQDRPLVEHAIERIAVALRRGRRPGQLLQEAAQVFARNVEEHAPDAPISPVMCAAFAPVQRRLQLVCANLAANFDALPGTEDEMANLLNESEMPFRSLALLARRRGDLDVTIRLFTGAAHALHRSNSPWRLTAGGAYVPGFVAGIEVHQ